MLLELGRNARELGIERRADRIDCRDDHDRNAGGDQTVFNCCRAGLMDDGTVKFSTLIEEGKDRAAPRRLNVLKDGKKPRSTFAGGANVRFGSKADVYASSRCLLRAKSGHR